MNVIKVEDVPVEAGAAGGAAGGLRPRVEVDEKARLVGLHKNLADEAAGIYGATTAFEMLLYKGKIDGLVYRR